MRWRSGPRSTGRRRKRSDEARLIPGLGATARTAAAVDQHPSVRSGTFQSVSAIGSLLAARRGSRSSRRAPGWWSCCQTRHCATCPAFDVRPRPSWPCTQSRSSRLRAVASPRSAWTVPRDAHPSSFQALSETLGRPVEQGLTVRWEFPTAVGARRGVCGAVGRLLAVVLLTSALSAGLLALAGPSAGGGACLRSVDADDAADAKAAKAALIDALADADDAVEDDGCESWTVELTGTFLLTDELLWKTPVPLTLTGPDGETARLQTVSDGISVTLERLVLTDGYVSGNAVDNEGGAVLADVLHLIDVELIGNSADRGGAVSTADLRAIRTSFVGNEAELGAGTGGAVLASVEVILENVTFVGNVAKSGGAVHMDLVAGTTGAAFDATFVTFLDNDASVAGGGSDLFLAAATGVDLPIVLRGVLFGGVGSGSQPSCGGGRFGTPVTGLTWTASLATDTSCGGPAESLIDPLAYGTVPFRTGATDLQVPTEEWAGLDSVACDGTWPAIDQRGVDRPQGEDERCDVGAVERETLPAEEPTEEEVDEDTTVPNENRSGSSDETAELTVAGPVPTSVPAGGGGCADGCPLLESQPCYARHAIISQMFGRKQIFGLIDERLVAAVGSPRTERDNDSCSESMQRHLRGDREGCQLRCIRVKRGD
jgi:hypothetical protein